MSLSNNQKALLSGATAGATGFTLTMPVDYIKQHLQSGSSLMNISKEIGKNGGRVLFKGGFIGIGSIVPQMAIKYYSFNYLTEKNISRPVAGFCAGLLDGAFLGPILGMQSLKQMNMSNRLIKGNIGQLMVPMALRNAAYTSVILGNYSYLKNFMYGKKEVNFMDNLLIGSILNVPATIICSPFDVIRANHISQLGKKSLKDNIVDILKKDGWRGFYRGYGSLYLNFAIRFPLTLALQCEIMKNL